MDIADGGRKRRVPHQLLQGIQIRSQFEHVGGETVAKVVNSTSGSDPGGLFGVIRKKDGLGLVFSVTVEDNPPKNQPKNANH